RDRYKSDSERRSDNADECTCEEHATSYLVDIRYGPAVIFSKELQFNSNLIVLQISFKEIHVVLKGVFT
ncbi:unnamed protein product, partial [Symbiodinium sp. KB8]